MAVTYKVLGQSNPSATTATDVYTVGAGKSAVVSTINVCNTVNTSATFRLAIRPAGATLTTAHYLAYDVTLPANDSLALSIGITMAATDVLTVYASTANVCFNVFGSEVA